MNNGRRRSWVAQIQGIDKLEHRFCWDVHQGHQVEGGVPGLCHGCRQDGAEADGQPGTASCHLDFGLQKTILDSTFQNGLGIGVGSALARGEETSSDHLKRVLEGTEGAWVS